MINPDLNPNLRLSCSIDNETTISLRLPVGEGYSGNSSNGTSTGTRYVYQQELSNASSSYNHQDGLNRPYDAFKRNSEKQLGSSSLNNNHTDIVTTESTSIN